MSWRAYRSWRLWVSLAFLAIALLKLAACAPVPRPQVGSLAWQRQCASASPFVVPDGCSVVNMNTTSRVAYAGANDVVTFSGARHRMIVKPRDVCDTITPDGSRVCPGQLNPGQ